MFCLCLSHVGFITSLVRLTEVLQFSVYFVNALFSEEFYSRTRLIIGLLVRTSRSIAAGMKACVLPVDLSTQEKIYSIIIISLDHDF